MFIDITTLLPRSDLSTLPTAVEINKTVMTSLWIFLLIKLLIKDPALYKEGNQEIHHRFKSKWCHILVNYFVRGNYVIAIQSHTKIILITIVVILIGIVFTITMAVPITITNSVTIKWQSWLDLIMIMIQITSGLLFIKLQVAWR